MKFAVDTSFQKLLRLLEVLVSYIKIILRKSKKQLSWMGKKTSMCVCIILILRVPQLYLR